MLRHITSAGTFETSDPAMARQILDAAYDAEQRALNKAYSVKGLAARLELSARRTYDLLTQGKIGFYCAGLKNYRVSERAVQRFEAGLPPLPHAT